MKRNESCDDEQSFLLLKGIKVPARSKAMMFQFSQVFLQSSHVLKWGGKIVFGMVYHRGDACFLLSYFAPQKIGSNATVVVLRNQILAENTK